MHRVGIRNFLLDLHEQHTREALDDPRIERAIGVIYRPETERMSHYFDAHLPGQFDLLVHFDETRALEPLERSAVWEKGELPETYPFAV
jgi:erythromycin esterase-like protein